MIIAERMTTIRVFGDKADSPTADSHALATSMLNRHASGAFGSLPPIAPPNSSFGASNRCAYIVAVLACSQTRGGFFALSRAERMARTEFTLESKISRRFFFP